MCKLGELKILHVEYEDDGMYLVDDDLEDNVGK